MLKSVMRYVIIIMLATLTACGSDVGSVFQNKEEARSDVQQYATAVQYIGPGQVVLVIAGSAAAAALAPVAIVVATAAGLGVVLYMVTGGTAVVPNNGYIGHWGDRTGVCSTSYASGFNSICYTGTFNPTVPGPYTPPPVALNPPANPVDNAPKARTKSQQWYAKCQVVCNNSVVGHVYGQAVGQCSDAQSDANRQVQQGCYKRHCDCKTTPHY